PALVGLRAQGEAALSAGAHLFAPGAARTAAEDQGWVSSVAFSPAVGGMIGLGFLARGAERLGETVIAADPVRGRETACEVVSPHFVDPEGARLRG
ncbi:MAG: glycine cleavage T C-terminal barrel domain-containing protein, partial [Pseudomonadota bacterium]